MTNVPTHPVPASPSDDAMCRQSALAALSMWAFQCTDAQPLLDSAVLSIRDALGVDLCTVLELQPDGAGLLLRSGAGMKPGLVGAIRIGAGKESQAGYTLSSNEPVVVEDVRAERRFHRSAILLDHGVISGMSVIIPRNGTPYGVLGAHTTEPRAFTDNDVNFLQCAANILAVALQHQRAEQNYRGLCENASDGIYQSTPEGTILSANPAMAAIHGYATPGAFIAGVSDIARQLYVDPARRAEFTRLMDERGKVMGFESQVRRQDGRVIWTSANAWAVRDARGTVIRYEGIVEDITARKQADEALQRLATAVEQSAECIVITDALGIIQYVNPAFERITGYSRAEAIGQTPRILKSGRQDDDFYKRLWETFSRGEVWQGHLINKRKDGTLYEEEATISPVRDAAGTIVNYVAVKRDVTREVTLEAQFQQAQKMEAIGRLAGGVAHDFNNLLTAILGYSDLALNALVENDSVRGDLGEIKAAGERAAALTRQLLTFSRKQTVQPQVLDLGGLVANLNRMLRRLIGEDIHLATKLDPGPSRVKADPGQIEQVIVNLSVNARDAMPGGGTLTIETANAELDGAYARQYAEVTPGRYVQLTVSDTGTGMTDQVKAHLFEPFFTTKEAGKGTGLGLATVFGIIKQSGGHVSVYSEPGHGTAFKVYLPRVEEAAEAAAPTVAGAELACGTETILLVEDEEQVRNLARVVLEGCGYAVLVAAGGTEALLLATAHQGTLDLLVTDMIMPGINGCVLARNLQLRHPAMRPVFMSGYTDTQVLLRDLTIDNAAFLQKPFTAEGLARKVREVLDRRRDV